MFLRSRRLRSSTLNLATSTTFASVCLVTGSSIAASSSRHGDKSMREMAAESHEMTKFLQSAGLETRRVARRRAHS